MAPYICYHIYSPNNESDIKFNALFIQYQRNLPKLFFLYYVTQQRSSIPFALNRSVERLIRQTKRQSTCDRSPTCLRYYTLRVIAHTVSSPLAGSQTPSRRVSALALAFLRPSDKCCSHTVGLSDDRKDNSVWTLVVVVKIVAEATEFKWRKKSPKALALIVSQSSLEPTRSSTDLTVFTTGKTTSHVPSSLSASSSCPPHRRLKTHSPSSRSCSSDPRAQGNLHVSSAFALPLNATGISLLWQYPVGLSPHRPSLFIHG